MTRLCHRWRTDARLLSPPIIEITSPVDESSLVSCCMRRTQWGCGSCPRGFPRARAASSHHLCCGRCAASEHELEPSGPLWTLYSHDCPVMSEAGLHDSHLTSVLSYFDLAP